MKVPISEIFYSLQGEGRNAGKPSIFVRFWGCNLKCKWCDTKYASRKTKGGHIDLKQVVKKIKSYDCKHIVFTGGEPTMRAMEISSIIRRLKDYTFEIETNGTSRVPNWFDVVTISPKLKSSGNLHYELKAMNRQYFINKKYCYKFVYVTDGREILEYVKEYKLTKDRIYIMPEGTTRRKQLMRHKKVFDFCMRHGFNFSPRLHILTYNNKKGV